MPRRLALGAVCLRRSGAANHYRRGCPATSRWAAAVRGLPLSPPSPRRVCVWRHGQPPTRKTGGWRVSTRVADVWLPRTPTPTPGTTRLSRAKLSPSQMSWMTPTGTGRTFIYNLITPQQWCGAWRRICWCYMIQIRVPPPYCYGRRTDTQQMMQIHLKMMGTKSGAYQSLENTYQS